MDICYCHPHPKGNKSRHRIWVSWAIWVMTVSLELFDAVLVIETTGNTVCSLSQSIIVHMAFKRHGVQSEKLTHFQYMTSAVKLLYSFMFSVFVKCSCTLYNCPSCALHQNWDVSGVQVLCVHLSNPHRLRPLLSSGPAVPFSNALPDVLRGQRPV